MIEQMKLLPSRNAGDILDRAIALHQPSEMWILLSGGKDSTVTADYLLQNFRDEITGILHLQTGIGLASTYEFVQDFCCERKVRLMVASAAAGEYERMVMEHGFPGPGGHRYPYIRLKERALDAFIASRKKSWRDRIGLVTGVRIAESNRRMGTCIDVNRDGAKLWVAPLIDWSNHDMDDYRSRYDVPMSPAALALHHSYECLCGAMADDDAQDEFGWLKAYAPNDPSVLLIESLQERLSAVGNPRCKWGVKVENPEPIEESDENAMPLFFECVNRGAA